MVYADPLHRYIDQKIMIVCPEVVKRHLMVIVMELVLIFSLVSVFDGEDKIVFNSIH